MPQGIIAVNALRQMGQMPFAPPNVKGWDGGKAWINTSTLLFRYNLANFELNNGALNVQQMQKIAGANKAMNRLGFDIENRKPVDLAKIAPPSLRTDPQKLVAGLAFRLYQSPLSAHDARTFTDFLLQKNNDTSDQTVRDLLHLMMSTPQYQLT